MVRELFVWQGTCQAVDKGSDKSTKEIVRTMHIFRCFNLNPFSLGTTHPRMYMSAGSFMHSHSSISWSSHGTLPATFHVPIVTLHTVMKYKSHVVLMFHKTMPKFLVCINFRTSHPLYLCIGREEFLTSPSYASTDDHLMAFLDRSNTQI